MYNILIRPLKEDDAKISFRWRNDQDIWQYTGHKPDKYITQEIELEWIRRVLREDDSFRFAILADSVYIGNIQITEIVPGKDGEFHIFIGEKSYWNKGIARNATFQLLMIAKEKLGLKSLYLFVKPENLAAVNLYEKCGFIKVSDEIKMIRDLSLELSPLVSVFMMAYNHDKFIEKAIESVIYQKTNFDFELVIGDDFSRDHTRSVIMAMNEKFPGKLKLLFHNEHIGAVANQMAVLSACTGKYIAFCEGDDFWIDDHKLHSQIVLLESDPEVSLVYSDIITVDKNGKQVVNENLDLVRNRYRSGYLFTDLLAGNFINTCTAVVRRDKLPEGIHDANKYWYCYDYWLWLRIAARGKIHFIDKATSAYRIHESNVSKTTEFKDKRKSFYLYYDVIEAFSRTNSRILTVVERRIILRKLISLFRQSYGTIQQKSKIMVMMGRYLPGITRLTAIYHGIMVRGEKNLINTN